MKRWRNTLSTSSLPAPFKALALTLLGATLVACGGSDAGVGPGEKMLLGTWQMEGAQPIGSPAGNIRIENAVVSYARDGTSDYDAVLVIDDPTLAEAERAYALDGDVRWTLEETILTRTLDAMRVTPVTATPQSEATAKLYEQGLSTSPPAQFIVERVDDAQLILLDPESGNTLTFNRR